MLCSLPYPPEGGCPLPRGGAGLGLTDRDYVPGNNLIAGNGPPLPASVYLGGDGVPSVLGMLLCCAPLKTTGTLLPAHRPTGCTWIMWGLLPIFRISDMFRICCCTREASKATSMESVKTL